MRYKLRLEKVDYDRNIIQCTEVWVTEDMIKSSNSIDVLKMCASQLIDKYRSDNNIREPRDEYNVYRNIIESPMLNVPHYLKDYIK